MRGEFTGNSGDFSLFWLFDKSGFLWGIGRGSSVAPYKIRHRGHQRIDMGKLGDYRSRPRRKAKTALERFESYIEPVTESGCWIWIGAIASMGYGAFYIESEGTIGAHRASWILFRGAIPPGQYVLHRCDVMPCVNPNHLFLGTPKDNMEDRDRKGRGGRGWKLSEEAIHAIRESTDTQTNLAKRFNVTQAHISLVKTRQTWLWLRDKPDVVQVSDVPRQSSLVL